ncbi:hypothetical protein G8S55_01335 [Clostridium botulinum C]|uniref:S1 family peptidase n=1 Tax=Clostridium botulinum TaxID=1491 RepID=UPI001E34D1DE|nr:S1 family peptidase [Clostridium botulinum]MCD3215892.1 hypothetical protein [Clostridium botulinum C]MCD3244360.1 hypothetical protein [Clostridium botulinum C]MCD3260918.1 hypothetical protein [Clostridium botulinum C]
MINIDKKIKYILKNEYKYFLNKPNVFGVGLGYKVKNGFYTCEKCIQVFVTKKLSCTELNSYDLIPKLYKEIPTDVKETEYFTPCSLTERVRPVLGGYSISSKNNHNIGTVGCLVTNGVSKFLLSTNHVLANVNTIPLGTPIIQPSYNDGGSIPDTIATLYKYIPLRISDEEHEPTNLTDCAIGLLIEPNILSSKIALIGTLNGIKNPYLNEVVKKVGRTTELTEGMINSTDVFITMLYPPNDRRCLFNNIILTTRMSEKGDSGSLLVNKNNFGIGLLIGQNPTFSVYCRLDTVLDQLGMHLVT